MRLAWRPSVWLNSSPQYEGLSIAAAIATILLKGVVWWLTGSVGLLSDALESFINLAGALMAFAMLTVVTTPVVALSADPIKP